MVSNPTGGQSRPGGRSVLVTPSGKEVGSADPTRRVVVKEVKRKTSKGSRSTGGQTLVTGEQVLVTPEGEVVGSADTSREQERVQEQERVRQQQLQQVKQQQIKEQSRTEDPTPTQTERRLRQSLIREQRHLPAEDVATRQTLEPVTRTPPKDAGFFTPTEGGVGVSKITFEEPKPKKDIKSDIAIREASLRIPTAIISQATAQKIPKDVSRATLTNISTRAIPKIEETVYKTSPLTLGIGNEKVRRFQAQVVGGNLRDIRDNPTKNIVLFTAGGTAGTVVKSLKTGSVGLRIAQVGGGVSTGIFAGQTIQRVRAEPGRAGEIIGVAGKDVALVGAGFKASPKLKIVSTPQKPILKIRIKDNGLSKPLVKIRIKNDVTGGIRKTDIINVGRIQRASTGVVGRPQSPIRTINTARVFSITSRARGSAINTVIKGIKPRQVPKSLTQTIPTTATKVGFRIDRPIITKIRTPQLNTKPLSIIRFEQKQRANILKVTRLRLREPTTKTQIPTQIFNQKQLQFQLQRPIQQQVKVPSMVSTSVQSPIQVPRAKFLPTSFQTESISTLPRQPRFNQQIQIQREIPKFKTLTLTSPLVSQIQPTVTRSRSRTRITPVQFQPQGQTPKLIETPTLIPRIDQTPRQKQRQRQAFNFRLKQAQEFKFQETTKTFQFPKFRLGEGISSTRKRGRFPVEVRRRGVFRRIGFGRTRGQAIRLGKETVSKTLARSFRIPTTGVTKVTGFRTKKEKKGIVFIEPSRRALSTRTELSEIQVFKRRKGRLF